MTYGLEAPRNFWCFYDVEMIYFRMEGCQFSGLPELLLVLAPIILGTTKTFREVWINYRLIFFFSIAGVWAPQNSPRKIRSKKLNYFYTSLFVYYLLLAAVLGRKVIFPKNHKILPRKLTLHNRYHTVFL